MINNMDETISIRPAQPADVPAIVGLIHELALYEKLEHEVRANPEDLRAHLFGERPFAEAIVAEVDDQVVGFALFFHNYSTFRSKPGIYLEDLFVRTEHRGKGIGKALLKTIAKLVVERGGGRFEWAVLDWNVPAIDFYRSLGAAIGRLDGLST